MQAQRTKASCVVDQRTASSITTVHHTAPPAYIQCLLAWLRACGLRSNCQPPQSIATKASAMHQKASSPSAPARPGDPPPPLCLSTRTHKALLCCGLMQACPVCGPAGTWRPLDETLSPCDPLEFSDMKVRAGQEVQGRGGQVAQGRPGQGRRCW